MNDDAANAGGDWTARARLADLVEENESLRSKIDAIEAPVPVAAPIVAAVPPVPTWRVRLEGVMPMDSHRQPQLFLDIQATTMADAWEKFKALNGITDTIHRPSIHPVA